MKKVVIGQAGGPTSVINATLAGFVEEVMDEYKLTFYKTATKAWFTEIFWMEQMK